MGQIQKLPRAEAPDASQGQSREIKNLAPGETSLLQHVSGPAVWTPALSYLWSQLSPDLSFLQITSRPQLHAPPGPGKQRNQTSDAVASDQLPGLVTPALVPTGQWDHDPERAHLEGGWRVY